MVVRNLKSEVVGKGVLRYGDMVCRDASFQAVRFSQVNANSFLCKMDYVSMFARDYDLEVVAVSLGRLRVFHLPLWLLEIILQQGDQSENIALVCMFDII